LQSCSLASGSKGNSIVVWDEDSAVLVDAGISAKKTQRALGELGIDPKHISAILVTHEHSDHVGGIRVLSNRFGLRVHATAGTASALNELGIRVSSDDIIRANRPMDIGELTIKPFRVSHDAAEPVGFVVESKNTKVGIATDLGRMDVQVRGSLSSCNVVYLEANHDVDMLMSGPYPWALKERILGPRGHLSNEACARALPEIIGKRTRKVMLCHLSETNNTAVAAINEAQRVLEQSDISSKILRVSPRNGPGQLA